MLAILTVLHMPLLAQVEAPSKLPSQRLESEFFTDNSGDFTASQRITLVNNPGDDSSTLNTNIAALSNTGGGVITIPAGTWEFGEIVLLSNVHLMFDENAIVKPVLSSKIDKSIFVLGFNNASISNVSIRAISGKFTLDMSEISYDLRVLPFNVKDLDNFMIAGCHVIDKRTIHSTVNCGVSRNNNVWAGARNGVVKDITVENAHDGYGAVQVRVGERLFFKNIISLSGGATLRIETDAHETTNLQAPRTVTRVSEISGYNIKCNEGNSAVMIQPWGVTNGWFDVEKIEATSCKTTVRVDRAFVDVNADDIGSFDPDSRITDVTSTYGTNAHIKDGSFKSVPCALRNLISNTALEGTGGRWFVGPTIAPVLYTASSDGPDDPRYYRVRIPSESELAAQSSNFPDNSLVISRWNHTRTNCNGGNGLTFPITGLSVSPAESSITTDETTQLTKIITPNGATNKGVTWTSSDEDVAYVDQWGAVTGISEGITTITLNSTEGNFIATATIKVENSLSTDVFTNTKPQIKIYPNPISDKDLFINFSQTLNEPLIVIYNVKGQQVYEKSFKGSIDKIKINTSELQLNSGLYFLLIKNEQYNLNLKLGVQ